MQYFNTTLADKVSVDAYQVPDKMEEYPIWIQKAINSHNIVFEYKKDLISRVQVHIANIMIGIVPGYWIIKRSTGVLDVTDNNTFNAVYQVYTPENNIVVNIEPEQVILNDIDVNVYIDSDNTEPTAENIDVVIEDVSIDVSVDLDNVDSTAENIVVEQPIEDTVTEDVPVKRTRRRTKSVVS